jgi:predicted PP-loop superfamily ATPase
MAVGESGMPLYMHVVNRVLRDMRLHQQATGTSFSYEEFKKQLEMTELASTQASPLKQRLDTLESFMARRTHAKKKKHASSISGGNDWATEVRFPNE